MKRSGVFRLLTLRLLFGHRRVRMTPRYVPPWRRKMRALPSGLFVDHVPAPGLIVINSSSADFVLSGRRWCGAARHCPGASSKVTLQETATRGRCPR